MGVLFRTDRTRSRRRFFANDACLQAVAVRSVRVRAGPKRGSTVCQCVSQNTLGEATPEGKLDGAQASMGGTGNMTLAQKLAGFFGSGNMEISIGKTRASARG